MILSQRSHLLHFSLKSVRLVYIINYIWSYFILAESRVDGVPFEGGVHVHGRALVQDDQNMWQYLVTLQKILFFWLFQSGCALIEKSDSTSIQNVYKVTAYKVNPVPK